MPVPEPEGRHELHCSNIGTHSRIWRPAAETSTGWKCYLNSLALRGAVRQMRIRIGLLAQPESMRSIIDATQREQLHGLACTWWLNRDAVTKQNYPQMNLPG